ncbi:eukaryotic translation initiation factor 2A isoform X2 [Oratosquilla oratoria]|uniref:eukaryotic translation initiation factor 2A isoform X2 n=1 Tax=Oratosquilla oratoria TaxID=337810 RepID=UPI003F766B6D
MQFAVRGSAGLRLLSGPPDFGTPSSTFEEHTGAVNALRFSTDGKFMAWIGDGGVHVAEGPEWKKIGTLKHPRAKEILLSPKGSYLAIWDTYVKSKDEPQGSPNLCVYDVKGRKLLKSFYQQSQVDWEPQWTMDETIFARRVTNEVHFYQSNELQTIAEKKILPKVKSFSLSPSSDIHHVIFFAQKSPAFTHLYRYPNFKNTSDALANKSFFKMDTVEVLWNKPTTAALLLTAAEVDKSGTSYYGEQMLFYLDTKGDSSRVTFSKDGNIHSVAWCPNGQHFFVVYGTIPSKATMFNRKCDAIAEFGTGARNTVLINPVGNIALIGGFGNISARFEMWDISSRKMIVGQECPDTTHLVWSPCGKYLLTSTCAPRLRVNNNYRVWHYSGALMHEMLVEEGSELHEAVWVPDAEANVPFEVSTKAVQGIESQVKTASKEKYIPPSQRGKKSVAGMAPKKFLSQVDEPPKTSEQQMSKSTLKNKKKREAAKKKKEEGTAISSKTGDEEGNIQVSASVTTPSGVTPEYGEVELTGDPEKDKKIKNIKKKLTAISKLKAEQESGKVLEKNQLDKIATENKLIEELNGLTI